MDDVIKFTLKAGESFSQSGQGKTYVYLIESGEVELITQDDAGCSVKQRRATGSLMGEIAVLKGNAPTYTVSAAVDSKLYRIPACNLIEEFQQLDPVLKACVEVAISNADPKAHDQGPRLMPSGRLSNVEQAIEKYQYQVDLITGIARNEFSMVYQPIMSIGSVEVVGFEALMRWTHPIKGQVRPDLFIKLAEDLGVISALTDIAVTQTCQTLRKLNDQLGNQTELFASINISGHDMARADFPDRLAFNIEANGIEPAQIKLEVTETAIIPNNATVIDNLAALEALGCGLSIDDFGTGYSNLSHLKSLPLSALKIDQSFAGDACNNKVSRSIVSMLVGLGQSLEVDVVAEGVETLEDVEALDALGCKLAQGFYYHRPTTAQHLLEILETQQARTGHQVA